MTAVTPIRENRALLLRYAPIMVFASAFVIYGLSCILVGRMHTPKTSYFDQLAEAFLQGRLYLSDPSTLYDLTFHNENWYVAFPPLPALLLLPWVAIGGVEKVNMILFSVFMGSLNVALTFQILQSLSARGWTLLKWSDNLRLTALFGIGSVHWYIVTQGSVWFVSQVCTVTFIALAALMAIAYNSAIWSGLALAGAVLARSNVVLFYPFLLAVAAQHSLEDGGKLNWRVLGQWLVLSIAPVALAVGALLTYNWARFGDWFDFGYLKMKIVDSFQWRLQTYGQFNLYYVPGNLLVMLRALPLWDAARGRLIPDVEGMSLLITTPALVYILRAWKLTLPVIGAWISVGLLLIPLLTYYNSGRNQFGYRFSLDFMIPVMVLLAVATRQRVSLVMRILIVAGILVNAWGVAWFGHLYF